MSTLAEFKRAERELAMRVRAFQEMKQSPEVQKAMAFETALDDFLDKHKVTRSALYELLSIEFEPAKPAKKSHKEKPAVAIKAAAKPARVKRVRNPGAPRSVNGQKIRVFRNPHTGEEITVRGNRDGRYNAWNLEYGNDVVQTWKIREEDVPPKNATA